MKKQHSFSGAFIVLIFAFFSSFPLLKAQTTFIETLDAGAVTLSTAESAQYLKIQQNPKIQGHWLIDVHPLGNYLNGMVLQMQLPEGGGTMNFEADYAFASDDDNYQWNGYNADGSVLRIGKSLTGYFGNLFVASTNRNYGILSLSNNRTVLVKYYNIDAGQQDDCGVDDVEDEEREGDPNEKSGCDGNKIRILFLYTSAANATGLMPQTVAQNVINELNSSALASGLSASDISFALANVVLLSGFIETTSMSNDLDNYSGSSTAHALRDLNFADIVILLENGLDPNIAGKAKGISVSSGKAYCIADIHYANNGYTATHEIGHLIGTRHQRCHFCSNSGCDITPGYNHGFPIGQNFRTIMYQNGCPGHRTRIGRWSNPDVPYQGNATGDNSNNNAKKLKNRASAVSCFRSTPPGDGGSVSTLGIIGPSVICTGPFVSTYNPVYNPTGPSSPASYKWEISSNGISGWVLISTSSTCQIFGINNWPNTYVLRLTILQGGVFWGMASKQIYQFPCFEGRAAERNATLEKVSGTFQVYPNPVSDEMLVDGLDGDAVLEIFSIDGRKQHSFSVSSLESGTPRFDMSLMAPGVYILNVISGNKRQNIKFIKQ